MRASAGNFGVKISALRRFSSKWRRTMTGTVAGLAVLFSMARVFAGGGSYNVQINPGYNLVANQFSNASESINVVLTNIPGLPTGSTFMEWDNTNQDFGTAANWQGTAWFLPAGPAQIPFPPGQGGFLYNPGASAVTATFSGKFNTPTLPLSLTPQYLYVLSNQTNGIGTFESITGLAETDGVEMFRFNGGQAVTPLQPPLYNVYTYCGGAWFPSAPAANVGEAVWILNPQFVNECIQLQNPGNILVYSDGGLPTVVEYSPSVADSCGTNVVNVVCNPPSGSLFPSGTTPVHCVAVGNDGMAASCDFTVTVTAPPSDSPPPNYTVNIVAGANLIANQLNNGGNTLGEILPFVPGGSQVFKYENALGQWSLSTFDAATFAWNPAQITLSPGEGALFVNPDASTTSLTFFGQPNSNSSPVTVPQGQAYLLSRQTNNTADYRQIIGSGPANGAQIFKFDPTNQVYDTYTFNSGAWSPFAPVAGVGESMWIAPNGGAPAGIPQAPVITQQPSNVVASVGQAAAFGVTATGSTPRTFQWLLNGNPITGATKSTYGIPSVAQSNAGNYRVVVSNPIGSVKSQVATLGLNGYQQITFPPFFSNAVSLVSLGNSFTITGNNIGAVSEPGAPTIAGFKGGASVWATWKPKDINGIYTLSMSGSSFDTLLGVYSGTDIKNLIPIASDDDSGGFLCSEVSFNATVGPTYYFQIDGFYGQAGNFVLSLTNTGNGAQIIPEITQQPVSQAAALGKAVALSVRVQPAGTPVVYQWFQNGSPVSGGTSSNYVIASLGAKDVGTYQVQITNPQSAKSVLSGLVSVESLAALTTGIPTNPDVRAADKFLAETDLTDPAPATGFSGSQVFSTIGATSDPGEPDHCGVPPCASQWSAYIPPDNGLLTISTAGTAFDNVLEAYTGPGDSFATLVPVACSNTNHGAGGEAITFQAYNGAIYWVVVSGVGCASGSVTLSYNLLSPPTFTTYPSGQSVTNGQTVTLNATLNGTPPFNYQWILNGTNVPGLAGTLLPLTINNFKAANQGNYALKVSNAAGSVTSLPAPVFLNNPFAFVNNQNVSGSFSSLLVGKPNTAYAVLVSSNLLNWTPIQTNNSYATGLIPILDSPPLGTSNRFYRGLLQ